MALRFFGFVVFVSVLLLKASPSQAACHGSEGGVYAPNDRSPIVSSVRFMSAEIETMRSWMEGPEVDIGIDLGRVKEFKPKPDADELGIVYTEKSSDGKERICRAETWELESEDGLQKSGQIKVRQQQQKWLARSPGAVHAWNKIVIKNHDFYGKRRHLYIATEVVNFFYLPDGRLSHVYSFATPKFSIFDLSVLGMYCFKYDKYGRVTDEYKDLGALGHRCDNGAGRARDRVHVAYAKSSEPWIFYVENIYTEDQGKNLKGYRESVGVPGVARFQVEWNSKDGILMLRSAGRSARNYGGQEIPWDKPDRNIYNQGPTGTKFWYFFPKPGPMKLLDDLTKINQYDRVRLSFPDYPANVTEVISGKGEVQARWFINASGALRQDVMKNGKLWRVLIEGGTEHIGNKQTTWWSEDPEPLKPFAAKMNTTVDTLYSRVYEVDNNGKWVLLAAQWTRRPTPQVEDPRARYKRKDQRKLEVEVWKTGAETVDGKKRWPSGDEMLEEYGFDEDMKAAQKWGRFSPRVGEPAPR